MRIFIAIFKNNFYRLQQHKSRFLLFVFLTTLALLAAIFLNGRISTVARIAVVSKDELALSSPYLEITRFEDLPVKSELVIGKYDAIVFFSDFENYEIQSLKNEEFVNLLDRIIGDPSANYHDLVTVKPRGTTIISYLTMFLLMQASFLMFLFAQDKQGKQIQRIAASPLSFSTYLWAHSFFCFLFLLLPTWFILLLLKLIFLLEIGFSLWQYLALLSLLAALASSFSLFINAVNAKAETAEMLGSLLIVLTSILAGSFYSFAGGNKLLSFFIKVLPQKAFFTLATLLETGGSLPSLLPYVIYILAFIIVFFGLAVIKTKSDYVNSR